MSEVDNSMITINGISTDDIMAKKALGYIQIKMNYTIVFHFKDGRIRVDVPSINKMTGESSSTIWQLTLTKDGHTFFITQDYTSTVHRQNKNHD